MNRRAPSGLWAAAVALALTYPVLASASEGDSAMDAPLQNARKFDLPLFSPSAPGFVVLGLSPRRAADAGSLRNYGFDVANLSGAEGYEFGGAFSFEPFWLGHRDLTLKQYQDDTSPFERILARTQISLAASYASGRASHFYTLGLGVQAQLLDIQDERYDPHSYECLVQAWQSIRRPAAQAADDAVLDYLTAHPDASEDELQSVRDRALEGQGKASEKAFAEARDGCRDDAALQSLAKPSLMIGLGGRTRISSSQAGASGLDGGSVWATWRQPLAEDGLISLDLFGRYTFGGRLDLLAKGPRRNAKGDETVLGTGVAFARTWWRLEASGSYFYRSFRDPARGTEDGFEASALGAVRIREGLWLQASATNAFGGPDRGKPYFGFNIKYDWSELGGET